MTTWQRNVFSSHISSVGYDSETQEMMVTWQSGRTSVYSGVPEDVASEASRSVSVGTYLRENVKGVYGHRYA